MGWLAHLLGLDNPGQSTPYNLWSGFAPQVPSLLIGGAWLHRNNCHARRCPRIGKHTAGGTPWCARHHPTGV